MLPFTLEKLQRRLPQIAEAAVRASQPIDDVLAAVAPGSADEGAMAPAPPAGAAWQPLRRGDTWGNPPGEDPAAAPRILGWGIPASGGHTHWLRATLRVPDEWRGQQVLLHFAWEAEGQSSLEAIAYLDGVALAGLDDFHHSVVLPEAAHEGEHELLLRVYAPFAQPFGGLSLQLRDPAIFRLAYTLMAAHQAALTMPPSDVARTALLNRVNDAYNALDLREGWAGERFAQSARAVAERLPYTLLAGLEGGTRPVVLATGHAHLDTAWLWPLWRTRQKVVHTVATALNLMERYPDYHFSMSQPQVYAYLKQGDPALFERMRKRVVEGRFEPVGMMWVEPDCNIPSGESLVRQMLLGNQFWQENFPERFVDKTTDQVVWLPDVFGYSAALPQLLRLAGISSFMTTKISWNQFNRMPVDTFRWRGIDGSEVLTHFVTATDQPLKHWSEAQFYTYNGDMTAGQVFGTWNHYRQKDVSDEVLYIYGYGDGGGGPVEEMLEGARVYADLPTFPQVKQGRVEQFFQRLYEKVWSDPKLPTWAGELYLEYHRGTYTSQGRTKQANRAAELLYREAEWLNAWATLSGAADQQQKLNDGWRLILLNQFHDILPGSSVPLVYLESNQQFANVQSIGQAIRDDALSSVVESDPAQSSAPAGEQGARGGVSSLVALNALPWARREPARLALQPGVTIDIPGAQLVNEHGGGRALLVDAEAPSYGYAPLAGGAAASSLVVTDRTLENEYLRITLDDNGEIASLFDKENERECAAPGSTLNQLVIYEDRPLNWEAWDIDAFYEDKPYSVRDVTSWKVVEEGPVRAAIEIVRTLAHSTITQRICLWRGSRRVDFITEVEWQERQTLLRALFPLNVNARSATCEIQFGSAERPSHRNTSWDQARFEVCAHRWIDMGEGDYGVALMNTGKYGHSLLHNTVGISLLKGAIFPDPDADRGAHRFTYSLYPHAGDWREAAIVRRAYELNAPLRLVPGAASGPVSLLSTTCEHIVVETVKTAEDGDGLIVRLYEAYNRRGPAEITFAHPIVSAVEVNLLEREVAPAATDGNTLRCAVRPFEVKTFRVRLGLHTGDMEEEAAQRLP